MAGSSVGNVEVVIYQGLPERAELLEERGAGKFVSKGGRYSERSLGKAKAVLRPKSAARTGTRSVAEGDGHSRNRRSGHCH